MVNKNEKFVVVVTDQVNHVVGNAKGKGQVLFLLLLFVK